MTEDARGNWEAKPCVLQQRRGCGKGRKASGPHSEAPPAADPGSGPHSEAPAAADPGSGSRGVEATGLCLCLTFGGSDSFACWVGIRCGTSSSMPTKIVCFAPVAQERGGGQQKRGNLRLPLDPWIRSALTHNADSSSPQPSQTFIQVGN